ncbi:P-loop NTPase [Micromonospora tulbaghiae]|uniref:P-loop NTPase n=1 Tax=Micromonospora tulbaghiae TaxID=479978 RepID=UPI003320226B
MSKPDWRCDICGTRMGEDHDAAARCESAGLPPVLPAGELLLAYNDRAWSRAEQGFYLRRLYPLPLSYAVGTVASQYNDKVGHFPFYYADVDPTEYIGADGLLRFPSQWPQQRRIQGDWIRPHLPGHLNQERGKVRGDGLPWSKDRRWIADAVGLSVDAPAVADPELSTRWVRPLTEPVRAVLDALDAQPRPVCTDLGGSRVGTWWYERESLGALALAACRTRSGAASKGWAQAWLASHPHADLLAEANERWRRWRAGEPGDVPYPRLRCGVKTHASKLNKSMKALVAATGVEWPPRTSSDEYVRMLLTQTLEYTMETTEQLFDGAEVVVVAGTKGGVGKSTVAAALARRLAGDGHRVALIDCDLTGPSQHVLFDLGPALTDPAAGRVRLSPTDLPGLGVFSAGQVFAPGDVQWNANTIADWLRFVGSSVALDGADVVILDLPPGDSTVHQVVFGDGAIDVAVSVHVTTAHPLAVADTVRGLATLGRHLARSRDRWRPALLVENLSRATGPAVDGVPVEIRLTGDPDTVRQVAEQHQMRYGGSLPWRADVAALADTDELRHLASAVAPSKVLLEAESAGS